MERGGRSDVADQRRPGRRRLRRSRRRARGTTLALLTLASLLITAPSFAKDESHFVPSNGADLGTRLSSGPIVVLGKVRISGMKARMDIERTFRGPELPTTIRVAYSGANLVRNPNDPAFGLQDEERAVLVIQHRVDRRGQNWGKHVYTPTIGYRSKIPVPPEGELALLQAVEAMISFQDAPDRGRAEAELIDWLGGRNPWLSDYALNHAAKYELADSSWVDPLIDKTRSVSPWQRTRALQALGGALARGRLVRRSTVARVPRYDATGEDLVRRSQETIVQLTRTDPEVEVRRAGIAQLERSGYTQTVRILEGMVEQDPSQEVRYDAAAALARLADAGS